MVPAAVEWPLCRRLLPQVRGHTGTAVEGGSKVKPPGEVNSRAPRQAGSADGPEAALVSCLICAGIQVQDPTS
jgi:hypothetical protein